MSQVLNIAKEGVNVGTVTSDLNLNFTSERNIQKIFSQGQVTVVGTPSTNVFGTISHGLGYRPAFVSWCRNPYRAGSPSELAIDGNFNTWSDSNNIYFGVYWNGTSNQNFVFNYYVLLEDAQ